MRLTYHKGKNFGDALNPLVFEHLLPNFFSEDSDLELLGIGSILGLKRPRPGTKKMIVFSSGFGGGDASTYGSLPSSEELKKYDFRCVRGPLTCEALGLDKEQSVCDGAILLPEAIPASGTKKYTYSYIPHLGSLKYYSKWRELMDSIGVNLIDPTQDVAHVVSEIQASEVLMAEAMHGAIIADTFRVPWIPVISNKTINEFKWRDFCQSMDLEYLPNRVPTLFDHEILKGIFKQKLGVLDSGLLTSALASGMKVYQNVYLQKSILTRFQKMKEHAPILSQDSILEKKKSILLERLYQVQKDYAP